MARRPLQVVERSDAADSVRAFALRAPKQKRLSTPRSAIEKYAAQVEAMIESGEWRAVKPSHFVALYAWCHRATYGVAPEELVGRQWTRATMQAARMLKSDFGDDADAMLDYLRWVWAREGKREKWRRENGAEDRPRVTWASLFCGRYFLSDYRVDQQRRRENGGR